MVQEDGGHDSIDLDLEFGGFDDVEARDERVDEDGEIRAVVDGDGVRFAGDLDDALGAPGEEDALRQLCLDLHDVWAGVVVVLDNPFVAVELFPWRLFGPHTLWFRLLGGYGGFAP